MGYFRDRFKWWVMDTVYDSDPHNELLNAPEVLIQKIPHISTMSVP